MLYMCTTIRLQSFVYIKTLFYCAENTYGTNKGIYLRSPLEFVHLIEIPVSLCMTKNGS